MSIAASSKWCNLLLLAKKLTTDGLCMKPVIKTVAPGPPNCRLGIPMFNQNSMLELLLMHLENGLLQVHACILHVVTIQAFSLLFCRIPGVGVSMISISTLRGKSLHTHSSCYGLERLANQALRIDASDTSACSPLK